MILGNIGFAVALSYQDYINDGKSLDSKIFEYNEDDVKAIQFLIEKDIPAKAKKIKAFSKEKYSYIAPLKDGPEKDEIITEIRNFYESSSSNLRSRPDKGVELRFSVGNTEELNRIKINMEKLGFSAGKYKSKSKNGFYLPYYRKQKVIRFLERVKPRKKNCINNLSTDN